MTAFPKASLDLAGLLINVFSGNSLTNVFFAQLGITLLMF